MEKESLIRIIQAYSQLSKARIADRTIVTRHSDGRLRSLHWSKAYIVITEYRLGKETGKAAIGFADVDKCWLEFRRIAYLVLRTAYPQRKIYFPLPDARKEWREALLSGDVRKARHEYIQSAVHSAVDGLKLTIYTDGACLDSGMGGWAYIIMSCGRELICGARMEGQTSNVEMEIKAVIMALRRIAGSRPEYILVCTDYLDLVRCMAGRSRMKPSDSRFFLFRELREAARSFRCPVYWKWVKGHSGNKFNCLCDQRLRRILHRIV